jgi:hypothetical protein
MSDYRMDAISSDSLGAIRRGATNTTRIAGLTHCFYRYPARFSPTFVSAVLEACSSPGDLILDPFMGGGTAVVEAMARGRRVVGCDLNSLAKFVTAAKTRPLTLGEHVSVTQWASEVLPSLSYHGPVADRASDSRTRNLSLPRARPIKKVIAQAIATLPMLPSEDARRFARCLLLNVSQWALHNRRRSPRLSEFRERVTDTCASMLTGLTDLQVAAESYPEASAPFLYNCPATDLPQMVPFCSGDRARLIVTSPPYPGIHILYHRWQVDGRKETPAPYWIADCMDGKGGSFYNFGSRCEDTHKSYFEQALANLSAIRQCLTDDALIVQMIAFSNPASQLRRYLHVMARAGFVEVRSTNRCGITRPFRRIRRAVPSRSWHATLKGQTSSSQEVVLIHRAA